MQKHVKALTEIFEELSIIGDPLDEENQVVHLLASLPGSYDMLVTALEASPDVPKLVVVTERLLHEERKRKEKEVAGDAEVKAMALKHRRAGKGQSVITAGRLDTSKENPGTSQKVLEKTMIFILEALSRNHIRSRKHVPLSRRLTRMRNYSVGG